MSLEPELQDLLAQLARFYRANETSISAAQVSKCQERLPASDISALDRLFGLFLYHTKQNRTTGISCHSLPARLDSGSSVAVARTASARASKGRARHHRSSVISPSGCDRQQRSPEHQQALSSISERGDDQQDVPVGSPRLGDSDTSSPRTPCSDFDANTTTASPATGETTPLHVATNDDGALTFSPSTRLLLEGCKTDRGRFLREIGEARAALPTGQGWEAAIATKEDNADMRDRMKIYHRFECYNIYKHVVEAGYHTGTHWIRDMRTALANKLCRDFPQRFHDQKTANKSLNWVDQGSKYHEWTSHFSSKAADLGYLIALPLEVPHSAYAFTLPIPSKQLGLIKSL
ncbi:hypothetical protein DL766_000302 [Monosporascus sp. MC13-8B]|uniref:Uncharacterized protein n=1 Tax=Monosporascus cannonballus TaxID=155416 RepID=A0ABY0H1P2_9PEZI|nr:hypothetical protein DL762_006568 [Monosporascus cannonballus]RYO86905.1 hypothetical protein DL763_006538 [Monosporascus cannonballus]RYP39640.1 hypothetical protein DL766_000302 [Monosporascus sp. MC13-8B]